MIVSIHQPNYMPWLGYFDKMNKSDKFVFLDDAQMTGTDQHNYKNRNKIKGPNGPIVLTVPVSSHSSPMNECKLASPKFQKQHFKSIMFNYSKAPFFKENEGELKEIYEKKYESLSEINITLIKWLCGKFEIKPEIHLSSEMNINTKKDERIVDICKKLMATVYISGSGGGKEYNREDLYKNAGIKLIFQEFKHPQYGQLYGDFIPNLSALDFLFNVGEKKAKEFFKNSKKI